MATDSLRIFVHDSSAVASSARNPGKPTGIKQLVRPPDLAPDREVAALAKRCGFGSPLKEELLVAGHV